MRGPVACLDIDYFFAQAEELRNPSIKNRPVVVCVYSGRAPDAGAVATCNYVARRFGVRAGMAIRQALARMKDADAVFLPVDMEYYRALSARVFSIAEGFSDVLEIASIDEAFLDLSSRSGGDYSTALDLMRSLKAAIARETGLSCSIGVARNKLLAKMASADSKPDGLLIVWPGTELEYLHPKPVEELPYVGRKTAELLHSLGVRTVGDMSRVQADVLVGLLGYRVGQYLHLASRGEYDEPVGKRREAEQMSRIVTLKAASCSIDEILPQLERAIADLYSRVLSRGVFFQGVSVIGISKGMQTFTRSTLLPRASQDLGELMSTAKELLRELLDDRGRELRRVGVRVYRLTGARGQSKLTHF